MARGRKTVISARKQPRQARSTRLVADILEAAARVLVRYGAHRFTTARVAEAAGISVGSLYQYFPNKESILFRLQAEEWGQTMGELRRILGDASVPRASSRERAFAADLIRLVISSTGKAISSQNRSRSEVDNLAVAVAEMLCIYLKTR